MSNGPNCFSCAYKRSIPGDCHISCTNLSAKVTANQHGVKNGWVLWPFNFDPRWLTSCSGETPKDALGSTS